MAASRGYVNQRLLLGAESVTGAAVAAVKDFPSLSIEPKRNQDDQFYRPAGQLIPGSGVKHREMSEPSYTAGIDYNEITYILAGLFGAPTPTNPASGVYQYIFAPTKSDFGTPQTFTVRRGDAVASCVIPGFHFNSFNLTMSNDTAEITGEGFGYRINDLAGVLDADQLDEVQQLTITGSPTGGTFTLTFSGQTTAAIAYNATAADVQTALRALSNIGAADVHCYGSSLPAGTITIHFANDLGASDMPLITSTDSLTGGSTPATAISQLQAGGGGGGTQQVETATVVGTVGSSGAGNVDVTVTSAVLTGSPLTISVAVANNDTASIAAGKFRAALSANAAISAVFTVSGTTTAVVLTAIDAAANDATLNIAYANDTASGLTDQPTSANTTAGVAPTGASSYTAVSQQPVSKSTVNVYFDSTYGALGTTKFCDALELGISIPALRNPVKVLCTAYPDFKDSVQQAIEEARINTTLIKNTDVLSFVDSFNANNKPTRYVRYEMIGANITGAYYYKVLFDFAVKCETPEERGNVQEVYAYGINSRLVADADIPGGIRVTLVNTLSGL